jgi:drug/metabolite transporter (DMT)-like permease
MPAMSAPLLMLLASLLFALMAVCVKFASGDYGAGEIVLYRSLIGLVLMAAVLRGRGTPLKTPVPAMHFWRSLAGTSALCLWFYALGALPLGTAMTLNYMSSVWIACFLMGAALLSGPGTPARIDGRLFAAVLAGFAGVALVLRPTIAQDQLWHGLCGLLSGLLAAMAYLQVTALGRAGEPEERVVFYFSVSGVVSGLALALATTGLQGHSARGLALLGAIGLLATAAQWMMTRAYAIGSTLVVAALQFMGIVYSFLLGVWLFHDPVTAQSLAGTALILAAGLAATFLRPRMPAAQVGLLPSRPTDS